MSAQVGSAAPEASPLEPAGGVELVLGFLIGLSVVGVLEPGLIALLKRRDMVDRPSNRSSHTEATPRGGGLAVVVACCAGWVVAAPPGDDVDLALFLGVSLAAVGFIDDLRRLSPLLRLALQTALALVSLIWALDGTTTSATLAVVAGAATVIGVVGYVNAFNFMDGINGISAAHALLGGASAVIVGEVRGIVVLTVLGATLAGAAVAFAFFNFPRALVFLGDSGSYFLGASGAALVIVALRFGVPVEAALGPLVIYVVDTALTVVRRMARRECWLEPHRDHAYQRMVGNGWTHTRATLTVLAFSAATAGLGLVSLSASPSWRVLADAIGVVTAAAYLSMPTLVSRHRLAH